MNITFKIKDKTSQAKVDDIIAHVHVDLGLEVESLFPSSVDGTLALMYIVECDDSAAPSIIKKIKAIKEVEFAEMEPSHSLKKQKEIDEAKKAAGKKSSKEKSKNKKISDISNGTGLESPLALSAKDMIALMQETHQVLDKYDYDSACEEMSKEEGENLLKKELKNLQAGFFVGITFSLNPSENNETSIDFSINEPSPFEYDSNWEEVVRETLDDLGFRNEYSNFWEDDYSSVKDSKHAIEIYKRLFKVFLAMGMMPENESWGYKEWIEQQTIVGGSVKADIPSRMTDYYYNNWKKMVDEGVDVIQKDAVMVQDFYAQENLDELTNIVKDNVYINITKPPFVGQGFTQISEQIDILKEKANISKNIKVAPNKLKNGLDKI